MYSYQSSAKLYSMHAIILLHVQKKLSGYTLMHDNWWSSINFFLVNIYLSISNYISTLLFHERCIIWDGDRCSLVGKRKLTNDPSGKSILLLLRFLAMPMKLHYSRRKRKTKCSFDSSSSSNNRSNHNIIIIIWLYV